MARISTSIDQIAGHYDVIVIGSGYGGGISASRMARAGRKVALLERGRELRPGEYPDEPDEMLQELQVDTENKHIGKRNALFDFRINKDVNVVLGCGLGGTSLINANVGLFAEPWVMKQEAWPKQIRDDKALLDTCFERASLMLGRTLPDGKINVYPDPPERVVPDQLTSLKYGAEKLLASGKVKGEFKKTPIYVTFNDGKNQAGLEQEACQSCGDCITGCNYGAKNTTLMNYLQDAKNWGAEIFTGADIRYLEKGQDNKWIVHYQVIGFGREKFDVPTEFVTADVVIVSAGTLGSTEILLRSKEKGLSLSDELGDHFSTNGDYLGFAYNTNHRSNSMGLGTKPPNLEDPVGPGIASALDLRGEENGKKGMIIEEGTSAGALINVVGPGLAAASALIGKETEKGIKAFFKRAWRFIRGIFGGAYTENSALDNTLVYLVMTYDSDNGKMLLEKDKLRISWPGVGKEEVFKNADKTLFELSSELGGKYIPNPTWNKVLKYELTTVHPLGGSVMGEDSTKGAVNYKGQVFQGKNGTAVHEGLYVADGSIIPVCLGVNPSFTIAGVSEYVMFHLAKDHGWTINYAYVEPQPIAPDTTLQPGIRVTEKLEGFLGAASKKNAITYLGSLVSEDLSALLIQPGYEMNVIGTVEAPRLSPDPLTILKGTCNIFVRDSKPKTLKMEYHLPLLAESGEHYFLKGEKVLHNDPGKDQWKDISTMKVTIYAGKDNSGEVVREGVIHTTPELAKESIRNPKILNVERWRDRHQWKRKFELFVNAKLNEVYA